MLPPSPFNFRERRPIFWWGDRQSDLFPLCSILLAGWVGGGTRRPAQGQCSIFRGLWSTLLDIDLPWPSAGLQRPICFNLSDLPMSKAPRSLSRWPRNWAALPHLASLPLVLWILKAEAIGWSSHPSWDPSLCCKIPLPMTCRQAPEFRLCSDLSHSSRPLGISGSPLSLPLCYLEVAVPLTWALHATISAAFLISL